MTGFKFLTYGLQVQEELSILVCTDDAKQSTKALWSIDMIKKHISQCPRHQNVFKRSEETFMANCRKLLSSFNPLSEYFDKDAYSRTNFKDLKKLNLLPILDAYKCKYDECGYIVTNATKIKQHPVSQHGANEFNYKLQMRNLKCQSLGNAGSKRVYYEILDESKDKQNIQINVQEEQTMEKHVTHLAENVGNSYASECKEIVNKLLELPLQHENEAATDISMFISKLDFVSNLKYYGITIEELHLLQDTTDENESSYCGFVANVVKKALIDAHEVSKTASDGLLNFVSGFDTSTAVRARPNKFKPVQNNDTLQRYAKFTSDFLAV